MANVPTTGAKGARAYEGRLEDEPACPQEDGNSSPRQATGFARWVLLVAGTLCALLGAVGAFLPLLPTTPFLIVAAACFVRSSPAFHRRLLGNRIFGPYLVQWQRDHTVPRDAKRKAYGLVVVTFALSIALVDDTWLRLTLAGIGVGLIVFLRCLPTTAENGLVDQERPRG